MPKKKTTEEFIQDATKVHGDKYDYSKVEYIKSNEKVIIICKEHGEFEQCPDKHINRKSQCRKCVGKYQYTNEEWIEKAKEVHDNKYDYSKVKYINSKSKVIIICKKHGEFEQIPTGHLCKKGCSKCSGRYKYTTKEWIEKAKKVHGDKYDYSKVEYKKALKKIIIICPEHGEFKQRAVSHLRGHCCNKCGVILGGIKQRSNNERWIEKAKEVHGNKYDYSKVNYEKSNKKVMITCSKHGEFNQTPNNHLYSGCPACGNIKKGLSSNTEEWIEKAKEVHGDKYNYSKVNYEKSNKKVMITCSKHGEFKQTPTIHLLGYGCSKCSDNYSPTTEEWIEKAKEVHSDKYDYSKVEYKNNKTKVIIICKEHGEFNKQPANFILGQSCPKCNYCPKCQLWRTWGKLCLYCKPNNKLYKKAYEKSKELVVVKYLKEKLPDYDSIHNRSVGSHCTKDEKENSNGHLFPDIRFDCDFYHLIVEVDEHKHRGADYKCDEQRMYNIIAKLGLPCIFIRYNPDSKESNKEILLEKVQEYLELNIEDGDIWNDFGFKAEYLFY